MPCSDGGPTPEQMRLEERNRRYLPAALCAVLTVLEADGLEKALDKLDYVEGGFTREWLEQWWAEHKEEDRLRREREATAAQREALREAAIAKLTPEEREALKL